MKTGKLVLVLIVIGSVFLAAAGASAYAQQQALSSKLIRLHVIANSDSPEDQTLKLKVRDAVLTELRGQDWSSREEAVSAISSQLQNICDLSLLELEKNGKPAKVRAELGYETYPTRLYDTFSLPSGEYLSLQITLGDGQGKNWWCVVYPSICLPAGGADLAEAATVAGLTDGEIRFITIDTPEIQIKFKFLEILESVRKTLQDT